MDQGHKGAETAATMLFQGVAARENQGVQVAQPALDRRRGPPDLGRPAALQAAAHAGRGVAGLAIVFPEQVHRADQPVLVRRHDPHGPPVRPQAQDTRPAHERDVVKMHDVGRRDHRAPRSSSLDLKRGRPVACVASGERMPNRLLRGWRCRPGGGV